MKLFVGNLNLLATDKDLLSAFERFGTVTQATVLMNCGTGENHGYGYLEMPDDDQAGIAINALNGAPLLDRQMTVLRH